MSSAIDAPVTVTQSQMLTQDVTIVLGVGIPYGFGRNYDHVTSTKEANFTNGKHLMSQWEFKSTLITTGELTVWSRLVNVVNDSEVKVMLRGVVLDSSGIECGQFHSKTWADVEKPVGLRLDFKVGDPKTDWNRFRRSCTQYYNMVTVRLYMTIEYLDQTIPHKEASVKRFSEISLQDFSEAMKELLASPTFTNAKIDCMDGVEICVNKEILASRSPVFEAMFRHDMTEAATGVVQVADIFGKSMKVLVEYLTTGKLNECWRQADVVIHLAKAADKYGIQSLQSFLDDWLGEEDLVLSNLELLNMAADCGYPKAEVEIVKNIGRRVRLTGTRDEFLDAIGITREDSEKLKTGRAEKQLMRWMNNQLAERSTTESSLEVVNLAVDEGLDAIERKLVEELGNRLELAVSRDEVLEVLGI